MSCVTVDGGDTKSLRERYGDQLLHDKDKDEEEPDPDASQESKPPADGS